MMAIYAQHGYGKSDKLDAALDEGSVQGVVFAARHEKPSVLASYIASIRERHSDTRLMLDPEFHLSMYKPAKDRYLTEYPYYSAGRRPADFVGAKRIRRYIKDTLDFQCNLEVDVLVSPTVHVENFDDREYQIALNLASDSIDYHAGLADEDRPLVLSFLVGEHAFGSRSGVDEFLDQITGWRADAVYLTVARAEATYSQRMDPSRLAHIMYAAYALGELNDIEVVLGYSDIGGTLIRAAGASSIASGWSQNCRRFHSGSFLQRKGGGRRPRLRYCSTPLLNSIFLGELEQIHDIDELDKVLSGTDKDNIIEAAASPESSDWNHKSSELQHWEALTLLDNAVTADVEASLALIEENIAKARALYVELQDAGVSFERGTRGDHLDEWADAIRAFYVLVGL